MTPAFPTLTRNHLLATLSATDLALLRPDLEPVALELRKCLEVPDEPIEHCYFIDSGLSSIVAGNRDSRRRLEVGLIGAEGITGLAVVLGGERSPNENFMQVGGEGRRIAAESLRAAIKQSPSLSRVLLSFALSLMNQTANTALANGTANVDERLARWLLMAHDRLQSDEIPLTHEFLSLMLGVRRAGVTVALNNLERKGAISLSRGQILLRDRAALEASANGTYRETDMVVPGT